MAIIVQREGERAEIVSESRFPNEAELQRYVYENPEVLPISDIKEDVQFTVLDKETPVGTGSIDILGVDSEGDLYIIETKLFSNSDKRKVLAQVLDYGAALWSTYQDPESFLRMLEERLAATGESLSELLSFGEASEIEAGIKECIQSGSFRFIIMMDQVPSALKDLIQFVNSHSNFSVYAVELEHYEHGDLHIFVPHVFGAEGRKRVSSSSAGRDWNEESYFQDVEEKCTPETVAAVRKLYEFSKQRTDQITWGRGRFTGSFNPRFPYVCEPSVYTVRSNGNIAINFGYVQRGGADLAQRLWSELTTIPRLAARLPKEPIGYPELSPSDWVPVREEFLAALDRFLNYAKEVSDQSDGGPTAAEAGR